MKRKKGSRVPPKSTVNIREEARHIREVFKLGTNPVDMFKMIEFVLPVWLPNFYYTVLGKDIMGNDEARTYPDKSHMEIREDVYIAASNGDGRAQFTLAHELGHLVMHSNLNQSKSYARNSSSHKPYEDSEWQADTFGAEFLMPMSAAAKCGSPEEIASRFGVSITSANIRYKQIFKS